MYHYSFLKEDQQIPMDDPAIDPNQMVQQSVNQDPNMIQQGGAEFEPLIKGPQDIPHSKEKAEVMKIAAQIREIEAKTKETLNKANNPDMGGQIDPITGAPMDPSMGQVDPMTGMPIQGAGQIDPMTGQPIDPNTQQNDPLQGLGDASAPQDAMGGMMGGGIDPMTGMPMDPSMGGPSKTFTAIGRAFKLKKIYDILDNLSHLLHTTPDTKLQVISQQIDETFELFRLVINNLKIYKDKVDDLIVMYYSLLKDMCDNIEAVYQERKLETSITESKSIKKNISILGEGIEE